MSHTDKMFFADDDPPELFTDRIAEHGQFAASLRKHCVVITSGEAKVDAHARVNVVELTGIGGIGKTELSRRLEKWVHGNLPFDDEWGGPPLLPIDLCSAREDFHGNPTIDPARLLLRLRAALDGNGRKFTTFDIGLAIWWISARPGEPLPAYKTRHGFDIGDQLADTANSIAESLKVGFGVGGFAVRVVSEIASAVRKGRTGRQALDGSRQLRKFADGCEGSATADVVWLAGLLGQDLADQGDAQPLGVMFADSAEYLSDASRQQLLRMIRLTPSVLWVISSREPVLNEAGTVHASVAISDLPDDDVRVILSRASGTGLTPSLSAEVADRIVGAAGGHPLYVRLSLELASGFGPEATLNPDDFGLSFSSLVSDVLIGLAPDEQRAIRFASLLSRFSPELIAAAADIPVGAAQRLCNRSVISRDEHALFPYRVHDTVAACVRDEDVFRDGAFAAADRHRASDALLRELKTLNSEWLGDYIARLEALTLALELADGTDTAQPWVLTALCDLPGMKRTCARIGAVGPFEDDWAGQVRRFFAGWAAGGARQRIPYLTELATDTALPADVRQATLRFLAYAHRTINDHPTALPMLQGLLAEDEASSLFRYQVARTLQSMGRYDEMAAHMQLYPVKGGHAARLEADLAMERAEFDIAIDGARVRATELRAEGQHRIALENEAVVLWRSALFGTATRGECDAMVEETDRAGMTLLLRTSLSATALCSGPDGYERLRDQLNLVIASEGGQAGYRELTIEAVHLRRTSAGTDDLANGHERFRRLGRNWTPNYGLVDRLWVHAGFDTLYPTREAAPRSEDPAALARWEEILTRLVTPPAGDGSMGQ